MASLDLVMMLMMMLMTCTVQVMSSRRLPTGNPLSFNTRDEPTNPASEPVNPRDEPTRAQVQMGERPTASA